MATEGTFYEDDEPVEKLVAAFEAGQHVVSEPPAEVFLRGLAYHHVPSPFYRATDWDLGDELPVVLDDFNPESDPAPIRVGTATLQRLNNGSIRAVARVTDPSFLVGRPWLGISVKLHLDEKTKSHVTGGDVVQVVLFQPEAGDEAHPPYRITVTPDLSLSPDEAPWHSYLTVFQDGHLEYRHHRENEFL